MLTLLDSESQGLSLPSCPQLPLKLLDGSDARCRARCMPMPEEQPVMSTTVRSMTEAVCSATEASKVGSCSREGLSPK